jgi:hypothetical protein
MSVLFSEAIHLTVDAHQEDNNPRKYDYKGNYHGVNFSIPAKRIGHFHGWIVL